MRKRWEVLREGKKERVKGGEKGMAKGGKRGALNGDGWRKAGGILLG